MLNRFRSIAVVLLAIGFLGVLRDGNRSDVASAAVFGESADEAQASGWIEVDYGELVNRRRLSHSGESVGDLLRALEGRPVPPPGQRPEDLLRHQLLDPLLEPYAFVLPDALDSLSKPPNRAMLEVGALWEPGAPQPAWVELLRARAYLVESDGAGALRICLPWHPRPGQSSPGDDPRELSPSAAAASAFEYAWPVLRHVFAAERRRLAGRSGDGLESHPLHVEVHAFVHQRARARFLLGAEPHRVTVADTRPRGDRPPLDLTALRRFLGRGLLLEGGRLESDGQLRLFGSESAEPPSVLGRPVDLSDLAVAYRAVFHGGLSEPYMSLDRGDAPQRAIVNYGGRLRDTNLGLVSLLCDIRFKTFSVGIDILEGRDLREDIRKEISTFRTHLERLSADSRSQGLQSQQTRLWFYPDDVEVTLSPESDVVILRRVRMTASSERVMEGTGRPATEDPPWTTDTVTAINRDYDRLGSRFPEMRELDQVARLLTLFAWLQQTGEAGLPVPEMDVLLSIELPSTPTPRVFPQLLTFNALPLPGAAGAVDVFSQVPVAEALDRLLPASGSALPAGRRFDRALALLDRRLPDHAALAKEMESVDRAATDEPLLDLWSFRAERLRMHQLVLSTLPAPAREGLSRREGAGERLRVFSVGIGGLDLGMKGSLTRAARRSEQLGWGIAGLRSRRSAREPAGPSAAAAGREIVEHVATGSEDWRRDPHGVPETVLPDHGFPPDAARSATPILAVGPDAPRLESGASKWEGKDVRWTRLVTGVLGLNPGSRRVVWDRSGRTVFFERLEEGRLLRFRFDREQARLRARIVPSGLPEGPTRKAGVASRPQDLALLELVPPPSSRPPGLPEPATVLLRLEGVGAAELGASAPRGLLQRLVLGREVDLFPGSPLPGFSPSGQLLGDRKSLMVWADLAQTIPPWEFDGISATPGEEDPVQLARALGTWWSSESGSPPVVVGTDRDRSQSRWEKAPRPAADAELFLPVDAFPGAVSALRGKLVGSWNGRILENSGPAPGGGALVVLVSMEAPAVLATRLWSLATASAMEGKLLAVVAPAGSIRQDVPALLLAEGKLAGLGIAEAPRAGVGRIVSEVATLRKALENPAPERPRVERLSKSFLWYF